MVALMEYIPSDHILWGSDFPYAGNKRVHLRLKSVYISLTDLYTGSSSRISKDGTINSRVKSLNIWKLLIVRTLISYSAGLRSLACLYEGYWERMDV